MSIFQGKLEEIREISIDMFMGPNNIESTAFFLSHCHTDHMVGLDKVEFYEALMDRDDVYLYTSEISHCILKNDTKYLHIASKIKPLSTNVPYILPIPLLRSNAEPKDVSVTLIPAGHCPGSVMFLFELSEGNILYTGDFRILVGDVRYLPHLHHSDGTPKEINSCYLDATFFDELYPSFPTRKESLMKICSLIQEWLDINPMNEILLDRPAKYGYEHAYVGIKNILGEKIHVTNDIFLKYQNVREIDTVITIDSSETRIHACGLKGSGKYLPCKKADVKVKIIRVSCMWYRKDCDMKGEIAESFPMYSRVCYSCHCSHSELIDFLKYLSPKKVVACAVPEGKSADEVEKEIAELLKSVNRKRKGSLSNEMCDDVISITLEVQTKKAFYNALEEARTFVEVSQEMLSEGKIDSPGKLLDNSKSNTLEKTSVSGLEIPSNPGPSISEQHDTSQNNESNGMLLDSSKNIHSEKMSESSLEITLNPGLYVSESQRIPRVCHAEQMCDSIPVILLDPDIPQNNESNGMLLDSSKNIHSEKMSESSLEITLNPGPYVSEPQRIPRVCHAEQTCDSISVNPLDPGIPQKKEFSGSLLDSDSEVSPSLLPQYSIKVIDPAACRFSPDCYLVHEGRPDNEIEIITLSSDESPEIFVMD